MTAQPSNWEPLPNVADQRPLAPGTSTNTWAIWVMALLPLLGIVTTLAQNPAAQLQQALARSEQQLQAAQNGTVVTTTSIGISGSALLSFGLGIVLLAVQVLLAVRDQRTLAARGVVRPFPWGWAFLNPVYIIGRHVVVRRRVKGSLAPLWVWIVVQVVALAIIASVYVAAFSAAFANLPSR